MPLDPARIQALRFWEALDAFAQTQETRVARAIIAAVDALKARLSDADLEHLIATRNVDGIIQAIDEDAVRFALRDAVTASADQTPLGFLPPADRINRDLVGSWPQIIQVRYDVLAPYSVAALTDFESRAIDVLQQDMRGGVLAAIENGIKLGQNPRQTAQDIRAIIGLPDNLVRAINNYRRELLSGDPADLRAVFERALRDQRFDRSVLNAIERGAPIDPAKVEAMVARMESRAIAFNAETIARTATMDALNLGNRLAWQQAIADGKVSIMELRRYWIVARDERKRPCPRCLTIPALNPAGRGFNEPFVTPYDGLVMQPTLHYRCFLPGTLVTAPGDILGATKRRFQGEIVRIHIGADNQIACTPNHPILTLRGWVAAGELTQADHVLQASNPLVAIRSGGNPEHNHVESPIEEFANALLVSGGMRSVGMPVTAEDFHGDGISSQQVDVVRANRFLGSGHDAERCESCGHVSLVDAAAGALPAFASERTRRNLFSGMSPSTRRIVRSGSAGLALLWADALGLIPVPFRNGARGQIAAPEVGEDSLMAGAAFAGQILQRFAGHVTPVKVSHITVGEQFAGHVYNLEAEEGWYFANGIIAHNCRCVTFTRYDG